MNLKIYILQKIAAKTNFKAIQCHGKGGLFFRIISILAISSNNYCKTLLLSSELTLASGCLASIFDKDS